ncbi:PP2C family protein-serine/threonine phosphatase [Actinophytocola oryzae]|uniref:Serine phosphatase RsbU (Regulator of sigma subunit) n=1 Tax=Actinophytocola oryzae TaxID=502181 RepID=A0A4R7W4D4_9PSEU|nr:SpoIIE family protein phosphatase [Actinophytocola oryzae]TDV57372.1 serine phosphatase RsbU (regulator of sigma subunit) [Actinophytocola oryzae]
MNQGELDTSPGRVEPDPGWLAAPLPIVVADRDGMITDTNDRCREALPDAVAGTLLADTVPSWLHAAHGEVVAGEPGTSTGPLGERSVAAHPVRLPDGGVAWWLVDNTAEEALRLERQRTEFLATASTALLSSLNPRRCMEVTAQLAATQLADAAMVIAPGRHGWFPTVSCTRDGRLAHRRRRLEPDDVPGLGEALQGFPPVPSRWIDPASAPEWLVPDDFGTVGSLVVTPLPGHGVPAGALVLLRHAEQSAFSEDEELFARLFAARAGVAMSAAHVYAEQSLVAEVLMRELLPPTLREVAGVDFAGRYRAALDTDRVGGDFYDVHPTEDGETLAVLGDVCGKGLEAAVLTGKIRTTVRALLPLSTDHQRLLTLLNDSLISGDSTRFATLVLASVTRDGGTVRLRLTAAGHPPPLVVRANGEVEEVDTRGTLVGALSTMRSRSAAVTLAAGETCLLYTDGITEARGGPLGSEMYGEQRLRDSLAQCAGMPAEAVTERIQMLAMQWAGRHSHDDMAVLAITAPRNQHLTAVGGHGRGRYTA